MHLSLFINPTGHHQAAWRHPEANASAGIDVRHYIAMAQKAEAACFDAVFLADNQCVRAGPPELVSRVAQYVANFEPLTMLGALSVVTEKIGLIATASTSYNYPYQVARKFASLDFLSGGRIGWNIVTSGMAAEAPNFGRDEHYEHDFRYERATEFVEVCRGLWDSWEDDAFPRDRASGIYSDLAKLHVLNHRGDEFSVKGPLNVPRSPQGYPVHVQAGSSPAGRAFAARYAEMMFVSPIGIDQSREIYAEMKRRAAALGRSPDHIVIMPGIAPVIGRTDDEAREKQAHLQSLLTPEVALPFLSMRLAGMDLSRFDLDQPLPDDLPPPPPAAVQSGYYNIIERARRERLTIRELAMRSAGSLVGLQVAGSAERIADLMEEWVTAGACDGFNVQPPYMPGAFDDFVELVLPILQERGLARREYRGATLREHFGLPRPENRHVSEHDALRRSDIAD